MASAMSRQFAVFSFQPGDTVAIRPIRKVAKRGVTQLATLALLAWRYQKRAPARQLLAKRPDNEGAQLGGSKE
jgi:hypothetical protein